MSDKTANPYSFYTSPPNYPYNSDQEFKDAAAVAGDTDPGYAPATEAPQGAAQSNSPPGLDNTEYWRGVHAAAAALEPSVDTRDVVAMATAMLHPAVVHGDDGKINVAALAAHISRIRRALEIGMKEPTVMADPGYAGGVKTEDQNDFYGAAGLTGNGAVYVNVDGSPSNGETLTRGIVSIPTAPAVPISESVTPDYIVCLDDGKKFKSLKRHLSKLGMTPDEYRAKWGLPTSYPMVCPAYAAERSALAKAAGFGTQAHRRKVADDVRSINTDPIR